MNLIQTKIREYRRAHDISLRELERRLGGSITSVHLAHIEDGRVLPTVMTLKVLARFLGLSAEQVGAFILDAQGDFLGRKKTTKRRIPRFGAGEAYA